MIVALERQVAPLRLCAKLRDLGAPQDAFYIWCRLRNFPGQDLITERGSELAIAAEIEGSPGFSAYTTDELGALIPGAVPCAGTPAPMPAVHGGYRPWGEAGEYVFRSGKNATGRWWAAMICESEPPLTLFMAAGRETEAEARAALLVWLVENGVVRFEKAAT